MTPVNILLNNQSILSKIKSCKISLSGYVITVSIDFADMTYYQTCDPLTNHGVLIFKIAIGDTVYEFMTEERDISIDSKQINFSAWGRGKQAWFEKKYSELITDTDSTSHAWQSANCTVFDVLFTLLSYSNFTPVIDWQGVNYPILKDSLAVSNQEPLEVLKSLTEYIGYEIFPNSDGSLIVTPYNTSGDIIAEYNDLDDIVTITESYQANDGYNAVTVFGYKDYDENTGETKGDDYEVYLSCRRYPESNEVIHISQSHYVRLYWYHAVETTAITVYPCSDYCNAVFSAGGLQTVNETVNLSWGSANQSMPDKDGNSAVTGDETKPCGETQELNYEVKYKDYEVTSSQSGHHKIYFEFEDKSANCTYEFDSIGGSIPGAIHTTYYMNVYQYGKSETNVPNVEVFTDLECDGVMTSQGFTDSKGNITINNIKVGQHLLKLVAPGGYFDSDSEHDLLNDNDSFEVAE